MCNENLDLVKLLGDCPKGTKLWCPIFGEVEFDRVEEGSSLPIICVRDTQVGCARFTSTGRYYETFPEAECILFPSKDNRNWSTFCVYKDGDFLANEDGRAFIFRGKFSNSGYPMAYGGVDTCDMFIECEDNKVWGSTPFRKATPKEVTNLMNKMKEAGYMWDTNKKELKMDLPIDTLVAICDKYNKNVYIHELAIRRYAGNHRCYPNKSGSNCGNGNTTAWGYIIPLDKLVINVDGTLNLENVINYGTYTNIR